MDLKLTSRAGVMASVSYYWVVTGLLAVLLGVMYYIHPYVMDDMWFRKAMPACLDNPSIATFLTGWFDFAKNKYLNDNGRLAQMLAPVFIVAPRWFVSVLLASVATACMVLSAKIAGVWMRHPLLYGILVFLWIFAMPWGDYMFVRMFSANYVLSAFFMLLTLWLLLSERLRVWSAVLLGLLGGMSHEMFCGVLVGVLIVGIVLFDKYRNKEVVALLISLFVALAFLFLAPSRAIRTGDARPLHGFLNLGAAAYLGVLFYAFLVLVALALIWRAWRVRTCADTLTLLIAGSVGAWILWRCFYMSGQRTAWCMDVFSVSGIIYLLACFPTVGLNKKLAYAGGGLLAFLCVLHLAFCIPWFVKMNEEVHVYNTLPRDKDGYVYIDLTRATDTPLYLFGKPNFNAYNNKWTSLDESIPMSLKKLDGSHAKNIGSGDFPVYVENGYLATPYSGAVKPDMFDVIMDFDGFETVTGADARRFMAADGREYLYIAPYYIPLRTKGRELVSVNIVLRED
ncbi:MAG: hypothetical protein K2F78_08425 [Muribaculaceae bacterium]|nr:hypothetical protein [Muribaculaceae bacterium]